MHEAFVYKWIDHSTDRLYIGVHKGTIDDGYICSSKYMLEEYRVRPQDFSREIIEYGTYADCLKLEVSMLKEANAAHSDKYYNRTNGHGDYKSPDHHSDETKKKISKAKTGIKLSPEHIEKVRIACIGKCMTGLKHNSETKKKMSAAKLGSKQSDEHKRNISLGAKKNWEIRKLAKMT